jgi:hypothetical protein
MNEFRPEFKNVPVKIPEIDDTDVDTLFQGTTTTQGANVIYDTFSHERAEGILSLKTPYPTKMESIRAGWGETVLEAIFRKATYPDFVDDPHFKVRDIMVSDHTLRVLQYDNEELKYLKSSNSLEEYAHKKQEVLNSRQRKLQIAANPWFGISTQILGDVVPMMLAPYASGAAFGSTARAVATALSHGGDITRIGQSAALAGKAAAYALDMGASLYAADDISIGDGMAALGVGGAMLGAYIDVYRPLNKLYAAKSLRNSTTNSYDDAAELHTKTQSAKANDITNDLTEEALDTPVRDADSQVAVQAERNARPQAFANLDEVVLTRPSTKDITMTRAEIREELNSWVTNTGLVKISTGTMRYHLLNNPYVPGKIKILIKSMDGYSHGKIPVELHTMGVADIAGRTDVKLAGGLVYGGNKGGSYASKIILFSKENISDQIKTGDSIESVLTRMMSKPDIAGTYVHELIHANTEALITGVRNGVITDKRAVQAVKELDEIHAYVKPYFPKQTYQVSDASEMLAGLANHPEYIQTLKTIPSITDKNNIFQDIIRKILDLLGMTKGLKVSVLDDLENNLMELMEHNYKLRDSDGFLSGTFEDMAKEAGMQIKGDIIRDPISRSNALLENVTKRFPAFMWSLRKETEAGNPKLAEILYGGVAGHGKPGHSAFERKRTIKQEFAKPVQDIHDAMLKEVRKEMGGGMRALTQNVLGTKEWTLTYERVSTGFYQELTRAHEAFKNGTPYTVSPKYENLVNLYVNSGFANNWRNRIIKAGYIKEEDFGASPYYFPRKYSPDRFNDYGEKAVRSTLEQAFSDVFPSMDTLTIKRIAATMWDRSMDNRPKTITAKYQSVLPGMTHDELMEAMIDSGISEENAMVFMNIHKPVVESTAKPGQLQKRINFDVFKEYTVTNDAGVPQTIRLIDLHRTDIIAGMEGYNNSMAGRLALHEAGIKGAELQRMVSAGVEIIHKSQIMDTRKWAAHQEDAIDSLLGFSTLQQIDSHLLVGFGNLANATQLKNAGLWSITDIVLAAQEHGVARILKDMTMGGLMDQTAKVLRNSPEQAADVYSMLRNTLYGTKYQWLHKNARLATDMTGSRLFSNLMRAGAGLTMVTNLMRFVHTRSATLVANIIHNDIMTLTKGAGNNFAQVKKRFMDYGMSDDEISDMIASTVENRSWGYRTQISLQNAAQKQMDYLVPFIKTGELPHAIEFTQSGKLMVGYLRYTVASTEKVGARAIRTGNYGSLAALMAYQLPFNILIVAAKAAMDDKELSSKKLITEAVTSSSILGLWGPPLGWVAQGDTPKIDMVPLSAAIATWDVINKAAQGESDLQDALKIVPGLSSLPATRILINHMGD